jgi:hypothetical protein
MPVMSRNAIFHVVRRIRCGDVFSRCLGETILRPIMLVVPYPPGSNDVIAHIVAGKMSAALGRRSWSGTAAAPAHHRDPAGRARGADGYTLLVATSCSPSLKRLSGDRLTRARIFRRSA